jgi:putative membrane protein
MIKVSKADHDRIAAAIAEAERSTSGEIFCVLARQASEYRETPLAWAAGAALLLPLALVPLGFNPAWMPGFGDGWTAAHSSSLNVSVGVALSAYALIQAVIFAVVAMLVSIPPVRRALTPRGLRAKRVRRAAMEQFLSKGLHQTAERTGVLIFAAFAERQVEVIADEGIYAKVAPELWGDAVAALTRALKEGRTADGFVEAIGLCGRVLAEHFPPGEQNPNELPDKLVEI